MKLNNWFVPVVFTIGILLIAVSLWSPQSKFNITFNQRYLARITEKSGVVKLQNNEMSSETQVSLQYKIEALDVLRTDPASETVIEFQNGGQVRIAEKSEVVIDIMDNENPVVIVRTGEIFIEKFGSSPGFWVRSEGQLYSASDYAVLDRKSASKLLEPIPNIKDQEQISQAEIENILNSKKNDFFKCYGQMIQKNPLASGLVLISFTIEKQGFSSNVEISKTDIQDPHFKACLKEVVARTKFRAFTGNPITTVFPLKFE